MNKYENEYFEKELDSYEPYCTNYRDKVDNTSVYLNLIGSDFQEIGAVKVVIYGKKDNEECNCTYNVDYYLLEAGLKYELYNNVYENGYSQVQIRFQGTPGLYICGQWSPSYAKENGCIKIGDNKGEYGNYKNKKFSYILDENGEAYTSIRTKGNNSSIYLNLIDSISGNIKVSIFGLGGNNSFENCTYHSDEYNLELGKKYELYNSVKEQNHSGVQLLFKGNVGKEIKGEWSPDYTFENGCITIKGNDNNITPIREIDGFDFLIDVPRISQKKKFPNACESVSSVMLLKYYNYDISVPTFIDNYLIKKPISEGPHPQSAFVGDPYGAAYGCFASVIEKSMNKFLDKHKAFVLKGYKFEDLIENYIDKGHPLLIWATIGMKKPESGNSWIIKYADENASIGVGKKYTWLKHEHCLVLVGYNENNYIVNDPYQTEDKVLGQYEKKLFEKRYFEMGSEALTIKPILSEINISNNFNSIENSILSKISDFSKGLGIEIIKNQLEPIFMIIGAFLNNRDIMNITNNFEVLNINNQNFYILGKITGDIISIIEGILKTIFGIEIIMNGIGGGLLGGLSVGPFAAVPVLIVSYSAVAKGVAYAAHGVNVLQSSFKNLQKDLCSFIKNNKNSSSSKAKAESKVWNSLENYKGRIKKSGKGKKTRYYEWDYTHKDIEVYDRNGNHIGSMNAVTGKIYKPPVKGRTIDI